MIDQVGAGNQSPKYYVQFNARQNINTIASPHYKNYWKNKHNINKSSGHFIANQSLSAILEFRCHSACVTYAHRKWFSNLK